VDQRQQSKRDRRVRDTILSRNPLYRNALSIVLLVLAVIGTVVQANIIRHGFGDVQARLVLGLYVLIAIYAAASLYARTRKV
jgi:glycerol uptake facilitator-like aquaporin